MTTHTSTSHSISNGEIASGGRGERPDPRLGGGGSGSMPSNSRSYAHLKDIVASAIPRTHPNAPLHDQIKEAEQCLRSVRTSRDFGRADAAYKDYLIGTEIVLNCIRAHPDFRSWSQGNSSFEQSYRTLFQQVQKMEPEMRSIRSEIEADNARTGVQARNSIAPATHGSANGMNGQLSNRSSQASSTSRDSGSHLPFHPPVKPKPEGLTERFAKLRPGPQYEGSAGLRQHLIMPEISDHTRSRPPSYPPGTSNSNPLPPSLRPAGPRDMPTNGAVPSLPPKLPLSSLSALPKAPSPTYSPVTAASTSAHTSRVLTNGSMPSEKKQTYYNQPVIPAHKSALQRTQDDNPYRPRTPNGVNSAIVAKSNSSDLPHDNLVTAETLATYMKKYNVLLIDVRPRDVFDQGHIFATSILCIEPVALREGMSADELSDRLVVSPEQEQTLFQRRDEFDIVVYYDQNTNDASFLVGRPSQTIAPSLRELRDTLVEFNDYKPLKDGRPPALLKGGIEAWMDIAGPNLATSKTAMMLGSTKRRPVGQPARSNARHRLASINSSLEVRKRRLRDHNPLNPDEEEIWRRKAQAEEVDTTQYVNVDAGDEDDDYEDAPISPHFMDPYDFLRRFPEVNGMQQSMIAPPRDRVPQPQYEPPPIPPPSIPSRPPPAIPRPSYSGQADLHQAQAPLARQASATRPALYASQSIMRRMKLPRTGLTNFGCTCYMNSVIQCLSGTIPLSQFFLEDRYKAFQQNNWKGSNGIMPGLYANLIRSLWVGDVEVIKPRSFREFCGRMNREWGIDRQQDAKEFLEFLVDCLHEDLNTNWNRTQLKPLTLAEEMQRERTPISKASTFEFERFSHRDYSYLSTLFAGQHASRLRCRTCNNTSTTYEAFYSISIEIPKSGQGNVYDCLRSYCQEEMLSGDEVWKCPYCKVEREATKQIIITRLPQFLIIHFKRFSASKTESTRKVHTPIEFPLYGFNMDHFVIPRPLPVANSTEQKVDPATTGPFSYDAYGVLRHLGNTGNGGHYISMVRDPGRNCWRKFDDERTYDFDPQKLSSRDRLTNGEAYIVFYQRAAAR